MCFGYKKVVQLPVRSDMSPRLTKNSTTPLKKPTKLLQTKYSILLLIWWFLLHTTTIFRLWKAQDSHFPVDPTEIKRHPIHSLGLVFPWKSRPPNDSGNKISYVPRRTSQKRNPSGKIEKDVLLGNPEVKDKQKGYLFSAKGEAIKMSARGALRRGRDERGERRARINSRWNFASSSISLANSEFFLLRWNSLSQLCVCEFSSEFRVLRNYRQSDK